MLKIIAAITINNVIGQKNGLPFRLADDMRHFKDKTLGGVVVSGSKTYFSIPPKFRPLPGRENIVLTRDASKLANEKVTVETDFGAILRRAELEDIWVIGGGEIYKQALPFTRELHLTRVRAIVPGDAFFPDWDSSDWRLTDQKWVTADDKNEFTFVWETWVRV